MKFLSLLMLILAFLACGTAIPDAVPVYLCPTTIPMPTPYGTPPVVRPTSTPFTISAPDDFYVGDAVFVGASGAPNRVRFRLQNLRTVNDVFVWELEVVNFGSEPYLIAPTVVMWLSAVQLADGSGLDGEWYSSADAESEAGIIPNDDLYELMSGESRVFSFAVRRDHAGSIPLRWTLDLDFGGESGNRITWLNAENPFCTGDVAG